MEAPHQVPFYADDVNSSRGNIDNIMENIKAVTDAGKEIDLEVKSREN
jgi:hypothetical protein